MIYFLHMRDGSIKIGRTKNLENRIAVIRAEMDDCVLLKAIEGHAREETLLHRFFACLRIYKSREFFAPGLALMAMIGRPDLAVEDTDKFCLDHWARHEDLPWLIPNSLAVRKDLKKSKEAVA